MQHMDLDIERAWNRRPRHRTVGTEQCGPILELAPTVVTNDDLGPQQNCCVLPKGTIGQVEVLRRFERPAASEYLIERTGALKQRPPGGEIGTHAKHAEAILLVEALGF